jgi:hypothetical protein
VLQNRHCRFPLVAGHLLPNLGRRGAQSERDQMDELGFDANVVRLWFAHVQDVPYRLIKVDTACADDWPRSMRLWVRRCYITDSVLEEKASEHEMSMLEILKTKLPDPGSVMAGDFGEIVTYLYHAARAFPTVAIGAKKWRLKQDRLKPAPGSDVINFILPSWPNPTPEDVVVCSEVKTKSTSNAFNPIAKSIEGCCKDRTSRLARTLVWLRERAITEDLGDLKLAHLERFTNATAFPPATKRFFATAIICESLLQAELVNAPIQANSEYEVVVISIPELHRIYSGVYASLEVDEG